LSAYYIDAHEVTNAEYRACVAAGACAAPVSPSSHATSSYYTSSAFDDYPVVHVTWFQAVGYCEWRGKRLPTEAEWGKAARGGCEVAQPSSCGPEDERPWPWGDAAPTCALANYSPASFSYCSGLGDPQKVGTTSPVGDSPYGAADMAGNVWEWVADWYSWNYQWFSEGCTNPTGPTNGDWRVRRGGSWANLGIDLRVSERSYSPPNDHGYNSGLRCALTP
jgi:formylglycine-generating enzyme required for sulfatase activity